MHLCIWVGAAIAYDDQPIIQIAGVANGRQHDAAGVDTGEHQRVDTVGAQQRLQVGPNERADAVLDHDRFPLSCRRGRMDRGAFALPAASIKFAFSQLNTALRGLTSG